MAQEAARAGCARAERLFSELDHLTGLRREARQALVSECHRHPAAKVLRPELARVTMARKIAAVTPAVWKSGGGFDAGEVMKQAA